MYGLPRYWGKQPSLRRDIESTGRKTTGVWETDRFRCFQTTQERGTPRLGPETPRWRLAFSVSPEMRVPQTKDISPPSVSSLFNHCATSRNPYLRHFSCFFRGTGRHCRSVSSSFLLHFCKQDPPVHPGRKRSL